jgi:alpha-1,3-rhamnosyltransferase
MAKKLVSVIIPSYNHTDYIGDTIKSVIDQSYEYIELIIIDDGSIDDSVVVISSLAAYCSSRFIRFEFLQQKNKGLSFTLNRALSVCEGEYLICIGSDDKMTPDRVERQVKLLNESEEMCVGVFGSAHIINKESEIIGDLLLKSDTLKFDDIFLHRHNLPACTQMLKIKKVRYVGGFPVGYVIEDWYLWLSLTFDGSYIKVNDSFNAYYRKHAKNTSSNVSLMHVERLKVLALFESKTAPDLYLIGKACCFLASSIESNSKFLKIKFILNSLSISPYVFFERKFYIALVRVFF